MGETTKIEWCDHTFNPWDGCEHATLNGKPSPGCDNCYAEAGTGARVSRGKGLPLWGPDAHRQHRVESGWTQPERWFRAAVRDGVRRRVFCASQGDVFEDRRDLDAARERLWTLIADTGSGDRNASTLLPVRLDAPGLDWLLLTKRPQNVMRLIPKRWRAGLPPNVWIGASVENQEAADERIPHLLRVPVRVRFLSLEPLLGPVDLTDIKERPDGLGHHFSALECDVDPEDDGDFGGRSLDWLIIGGESGRKARPCDVSWIRDLRDQGRAAGVPVFVKQLGARPYDSNVNLSDYPLDYHFSAPPEGVTGACAAGLHMRHPKGGDPTEWPEDLRVRELPRGS